MIDAVYRANVRALILTTQITQFILTGVELKHRTFVSGGVLLSNRIRRFDQTLICGRQHATQSKLTNNESDFWHRKGMFDQQTGLCSANV